MIVDALLAADPILNIAERVFDAKKFVYFTDNILYQILENTDEVRETRLRLIPS